MMRFITKLRLSIGIIGIGFISTMISCEKGDKVEAKKDSNPETIKREVQKALQIAQRENKPVLVYHADNDESTINSAIIEIVWPNNNITYTNASLQYKEKHANQWRVASDKINSNVKQHKITNLGHNRYYHVKLVLGNKTETETIEFKTDQSPITIEHVSENSFQFTKESEATLSEVKACYRLLDSEKCAEGSEGDITFNSNNQATYQPTFPSKGEYIIRVTFKYGKENNKSGMNEILTTKN